MGRSQLLLLAIDIVAAGLAGVLTLLGWLLLVKPGLTGLWQVSGRSGFSREESVYLDLQ